MALAPLVLLSLLALASGAPATAQQPIAEAARRSAPQTTQQAGQHPGQEPGQQPEASECRRCLASGRQPCPEHDRDECLLEDEVLFCSVIADCGSCGGTGFVDCLHCSNAAAEQALEQRRLSVRTRQEALGKSVDAVMGRKLRKAESRHFVLVWELDRLKVDKRHLDGHQLLHLYVQRLEQLYADYLARLQIDEQQFTEKLKVFVWWLPQDHLDGSLRFCRQSAQGGVKLMGENPSYSVCGNKQFFASDERLHRNLVHSVTHLLLSAQTPAAWIGNTKAGWLDEGLAHWFEDRYWGICDTYCFQEQNTNVDFKGGRFRLIVRRLIGEGRQPSIAEVFEQNSDTLTLPQRAVSFSYVDYLLTRDARAFDQLARKLKAKVPTREALKQVYGYGPLEFEPQWRAWVLATYPTR